MEKRYWTGGLTMRTGSFEDWFVIEKGSDEHDHSEWLEDLIVDGVKIGASYQHSGRFSDACVEGDAAEMLEIAEAIERRESFYAKRCAVRCDEEGVSFWSPRNSQVTGVVSFEAADALATEIKEKLG